MNQPVQADNRPMLERGCPMCGGVVVIKKGTTRAVWIIALVCLLLGIFVSWWFLLLMLLVAPLGSAKFVQCAGVFHDPEAGTEYRKACGYSQRITR